MAGNNSNKQGSAMTAVSVAQIGGLNTMGISLARMTASTMHHTASIRCTSTHPPLRS
ncbi:hypothetical protein PR202_gb13092 [Eleusine coracana subsp. coracana]|uniref:Uncharacterized protein n=1 Tax=Eleusine coracana subsp. coracana TaxID=191504 RepID=A0AAV5ESV2_ELECO|nr:hypothetical protein PR202_gb13092 [Eleusine coracana subsp. coracana]